MKKTRTSVKISGDSDLQMYTIKTICIQDFFKIRKWLNNNTTRDYAISERTFVHNKRRADSFSSRIIALSEKDAMAFCLKFGETEKLKVWETSLLFIYIEKTD